MLAIKYLKKSIKAGYYNYYHIQEDTDLDNIRNDKNFNTLIQALPETGDYLYILKKTCKCNLNDKRVFPGFTYQSASNLNLLMLRKSFIVDSIVGEANEVSKILNFLHWVHNTLRHDGQHENGIV